MKVSGIYKQNVAVGSESEIGANEAQGFEAGAGKFIETLPLEFGNKIVELNGDLANVRQDMVWRLIQQRKLGTFNVKFQYINPVQIETATQGAERNHLNRSGRIMHIK